MRVKPSVSCVFLDNSLLPVASVKTVPWAPTVRHPERQPVSPVDAARKLIPPERAANCVRLVSLQKKEADAKCVLRMSSPLCQELVRVRCAVQAQKSWPAKLPVVCVCPVNSPMTLAPVRTAPSMSSLSCPVLLAACNVFVARKPRPTDPPVTCVRPANSPRAMAHAKIVLWDNSRLCPVRAAALRVAPERKPMRLAVRVSRAQ